MYSLWMAVIQYPTLLVVLRWTHARGKHNADHVVNADTEGDTTVGRALTWNAIVMGVCLTVVILVADANWPSHMGEEQGILWEHVVSIVLR